jgi:hypothetical protein
MPNWCTNTLLVQGKVEEVQKLLDTVNDSETTLSLAKIIVPPEEIANSVSPQKDQAVAEHLRALYGAVDWYSWNVNNWGTKWDVTATIITDSHDNANGYVTHSGPDTRTIKMSFDSAWAPPTSAIAMLAKQFPNTNIYHAYDEPGCDFSGYNMYSKGVCVKEQQMESYSSMRMYIEPEDEIFEYFPDAD